MFYTTFLQPPYVNFILRVDPCDMFVGNTVFERSHIFSKCEWVRETELHTCLLVRTNMYILCCLKYNFDSCFPYMWVITFR